MKPLDIFVSHSWRYHDDWVRLSSFIDSYKKYNLRNLSLPWHDPAIEINKGSGRQIVCGWIEKQILPCHIFILLSSVCEMKSSEFWIKYSLDFAKKNKKHIIGLPNFESGQFNEYVRNEANELFDWSDLKKINKLVSLLK